MTEDIAFYVDLAREAEGPIVELAVGNGRVAIPVARETGRKVIGIDLSPAMLAQARERGGRSGRRSGAPAGRHARLRARGAGGSHLLALPGAAAHADLARPQARLRAGRGCAPAGRAVRVECVRLRSADRGAAPARVSVSTARTAGSGSAPSTTRPTAGSTSPPGSASPGEGERRLSLWWVNRSEWEGLIEVAGLEVEALYGDFDRRPLGKDDREFIWVARKPA